MKQQIIAMGGGGFSMDGNNLALDTYVLAQSRTPRPKVCFLAQASGEAPAYIDNFYRTYNLLRAQPSHLSLFRPHTADMHSYLLEQDVVYVGGGNTRSMLALWREWGLDASLRAAMEGGTVLAGLSAGAICWFEWGSTDSVPGELRALRCLGYLAGGCAPHFDGEAERRPRTHAMVASGTLPGTYGFDDGCGGHFIDGALHAVVASRPNARAYRIERDGDGVRETPLDARLLPETQYPIRDRDERAD